MLRYSKMWMLFTLAALLMACALPQALADETFDMGGDYLQSVCWQGDTLYLLGRETLYRWQPGRDAPQAFWQAEGASMMIHLETAPEDEAELALWRQAISRIVPGKDAPLALQYHSGEVFSVGAEGLTPVTSIPLEYLTFTMDGMTMFRNLDGMTGRDGVIWLLLGTDDMTDWSKQTILRFDVSGRGTTSFDVTGVVSIDAAEDDRLLLTADGAYRLVNGTTGEIIREYKAGGATAIWAQGGALEYRGGELLRLDEAGNRTVKGYVPSGDFLMNGLACSESGLCAASVGACVFIRDLNNPAEPTVLKVAGWGLNPSDVIRFSMENPDIALVTLNESAQQAALTGSADLYVVSAPGLYGTLVERGGLAPIGDSALTEKAAAFYESIRDALAPEGQLLAWPVSLMAETWSLDETLWQRFDLGDVPTTFTGLVEVMRRWQEDYADDEPDHMFAELPGSLAGCLQLMMREYILQCGDEYPDFTSDAFRQAAQAMIAHQDVIGRNAESGWMPLIYSYPIGFGYEGIDEDRVRMMPRPAIAEGDEQKVAVTMSLLAVSSRCKRQDAALRFIRWYADHMDAQLRYELDPTQNEPLRRDNYETRLADLNAQKASLEASLASTEGTEAADLKDQLNRIEQRIADWETEGGWLISAASIANYRETAAHLVVPYRSPLLQNEGGMAALDERIELACSQGLTDASLERLLSELNSVAMMVMEENR